MKDLLLRVVLAGLVFAVAYSWYDRRELRRSQEMTRVMLDARAEIQVILVNRARGNRPLSPEEIERIEELWVAAEYHRISGTR